MRRQTTTDEMIEQTLEQFNKMTPIFAVLSDENRQKIIAELGMRDLMNVNELTEIMPLSRPAISHHLKNLKHAGLVDVKRKGTENYYYLTIKSTIRNIRALMDAIETSCELL